MAEAPSVDSVFWQLVRSAVADVMRTEFADIRADLAAIKHAAPPVLVDVAEAARRLGKSTSAVRRMAADGEIPARRIGRSWRIDLAACRPVTPETIAKLATEARR